MLLSGEFFVAIVGPDIYIKLKMETNYLNFDRCRQRIYDNLVLHVIINPQSAKWRTTARAIFRLIGTNERCVGVAYAILTGSVW